MLFVHGYLLFVICESYFQSWGVVPATTQYVTLQVQDQVQIQISFPDSFTFRNKDSVWSWWEGQTISIQITPP